jgi:mannosyltransferase OCH1-like enzyme
MHCDEYGSDHCPTQRMSVIISKTRLVMSLTYGRMQSTIPRKGLMVLVASCLLFSVASSMRLLIMLIEQDALDTEDRIERPSSALVEEAAYESQRLVVPNSMDRTESSISRYAIMDRNDHRCEENFIYLDDREPDVVGSELANKKNTIASERKIPLILYQTSRSRCIPIELYNETVSKWLNLGWGYRLYDDDAMERYLTDPKWELHFPGLGQAIRCINTVQKPVMKADLWRYLVLFENGGIFADLDVIPGIHFKSDDTLHPEYDAAFVSAIVNTGHLLSQWFIAISPQHPLMYHSVKIGLDYLLNSKRANPIMTTGPRALYGATDEFLTRTINDKVNIRHLIVNETYTSNVTTTNFLSTHAAIQHHDEELNWKKLRSSMDSTELRSFTVLPPDIALNRASSTKKESYHKMNMTQYGSRGGHSYGGRKCRDLPPSTVSSNMD